jgi:multiple sugar transport system substrate-binding protein
VDTRRHAGSCQPLVKAYNASHKNQVSLTIVPTDDYNTKVGTAAAANGLPDLLLGRRRVHA